MRDQHAEQMRHDITPGSSVAPLKALFSFAGTISRGLFCALCPCDTQLTE